MSRNEYGDSWQDIKNWLEKEVSKGKVARTKMRRADFDDGDRLFLLERAQKAEATARVLRKVIKILGE